jgi:hypothetical protein
MEVAVEERPLKGRASQQAVVALLRCARVRFAECLFCASKPACEGERRAQVDLKLYRFGGIG